MTLYSPGTSDHFSRMSKSDKLAANLNENKGQFGLPLGGSMVSFLCVLDLSIGHHKKLSLNLRNFSFIKVCLGLYDYITNQCKAVKKVVHLKCLLWACRNKSFLSRFKICVLEFQKIAIVRLLSTFLLAKIS